MRAIEVVRLQALLDSDWMTDAEAKATALAEFFDQLEPQRTTDRDGWRKNLSAEIKRLNTVWQNDKLRQALMVVSDGKCWYCEAKIAQRGDGAVDHFRPKNRVAGLGDHPGYWWLACDWHNYRFACTFCNSARTTPDGTGGKQDHFPLWDEGRRAWTPKASIHDEQPLLLDPMRPADLKNLTFDRNGAPVPRYGKDQPYAQARALRSIQAYHLARTELNGDRRKLMAKMEGHLTDAELFARQLDGNNPTAEAAYNRAFATLLECIRPSSEFSAAARAFLGSRRGTSSVARELLDVPP